MEPILCEGRWNLTGSTGIRPATACRVHLTVDDWVRFASYYLGTLELKQPLLKPGTLEHLQTPMQTIEPQLETSSAQYGFGWITTERPWGDGKVLTHSGSNTFWVARIWLAPNRKIGFIAAVNSGSANAGKACNDMIVEMIGHSSPQNSP